MCDARAITEGPTDNLILKNGPQQSKHSNEPIYEKVAATKIRNSVKRITAKNEDAPLAQIL